ncbi:MAG TPA: HetP family heterocyst commitment protein [Coleofasciculaceae cyanobacterium]
MHSYRSSTPKDCQKTMSHEQFNQVVEAISLGQYSWACVLILRFAGYNPVHFIPYRTYSRLLKENNQSMTSRSGDEQPQTVNQGATKTSDPHPSKPCNTIRDLSHSEAVDRQDATVQGGNSSTGSGVEFETADWKFRFWNFNH